MLWAGADVRDDEAAAARAAVQVLSPALAALVAEAAAAVGADHAAVTLLVTERLRQGRAEDRAALAAVMALKAFDLEAKMAVEGWGREPGYPGGWRPPDAI